MKKPTHIRELVYIAVGLVGLGVWFLPWTYDIAYGLNWKYAVFLTGRIGFLFLVSYNINKRIIRAVFNRASRKTDTETPED